MPAMKLAVGGNDCDSALPLPRQERGDRNHGRGVRPDYDEFPELAGISEIFRVISVDQKLDGRAGSPAHARVAR